MPFLRDRLLGTDARGSAVVAGVALALLLGGGDTAVPWMDNVLELCIALMALCWFWTAPRAQIAAVPVAAWVVAALLVAPPLIQLVPLPPSFWHALPGRDLERQVLGLVGLEDSWRPLSMTPARTLAAALAAACAAIFVPIVAATDRGGRSRIIATIAVVGVLSMLVGTQQLRGGGDNMFMFYGEAYVLRGFQWNRNSEADVLLISMLAVAACAAEVLRLPGAERHRRVLAGSVAGLTVLFALGVVLTGSRTGMVLVAPVIVAQIVILAPRVRPRPMLVAVPLVLAALLAVAAGWDNPLLVRMVGHFRDGAQIRPQIWSDTLQLIAQHGVWGVGLGGYSTAFARIEQLELINPVYVAHAYEDYGQLIVEAGLPGVAVLLAVAGLALRGAWRGIARPVVESRAQHGFAVAALGVVALHSFWDYPLHALSLACVAACCLGMLLPVAPVAEGVAGPAEGER